MFLVQTYCIGCTPITLFSVHTYYISLTPNYTDFGSILHCITYIQPPITLFRITLSFKNTVYSVFRGLAVCRSHKQSKVFLVSIESGCFSVSFQVLKQSRHLCKTRLFLFLDKSLIFLFGNQTLLVWINIIESSLRRFV